MRENSEIIIPRKFPNIRYITGDVYHVYNQYCTALSCRSSIVFNNLYCVLPVHLILWT